MKQAATILGCSTRAVQEQIEELPPSAVQRGRKPKPTQIELGAYVRMILARDRAALDQRVQTLKLNEQAEGVATKKALRRLAELKVAERSRELVPLVDVLQIADLASATIRSAGERVGRAHGAEAQRLVDDGVTEMEHVFERAGMSPTSGSG